MINTANKGSVRCVIFEDDGVWYGVGLEFNIVESGDDAEVVRFNLDEAIHGYVESQKKIKGSRVSPLNQKTDKEYEDMWSNLNSKSPKPSPYNVKYYGVSRV
jgi:predicted RNase H-like HicB family nuclease